MIDVVCTFTAHMRLNSVVFVDGFYMQNIVCASIYSITPISCYHNYIDCVGWIIDALETALLK